VLLPGLACSLKACRSHLSLPYTNKLNMATPVGPSPVRVNDIAIYAVTYHSNESYYWTVTKGIIQTGQGTAQISVLWTDAGQGRVDVTVTVQGQQPVTDGITIVVDTDEG
jgi:hypothetical protein